MSQELDFANEASQEETQEKVRGPVPAGSKVMLRLTVRAPYPDAASKSYPMYAEDKYGLLYLDVTYTVLRGQYADVWFTDKIFLPLLMQPNPQAGSSKHFLCKRGGAFIKAICEATNTPTKMSTLMMLNQKEFPAEVGIKNYATESKKYPGTYFWNNELKRVLTPKDSREDWEFFMMRGGQEIINPNGAVEGKNASSTSSYSNTSTASATNVFASTPQPQAQPQYQPQPQPQVQHQQMQLQYQTQPQPQPQYQQAPQAQAQTQYQSEDYVNTTYADPSNKQVDNVPF